MATYTPKEHPDYPGYYVIPGFSIYVMNKEGQIMQIAATQRRGIGTIIPTNGSNKRVSLISDTANSTPYPTKDILSLMLYGPCDIKHKKLETPEHKRPEPVTVPTKLKESSKNILKRRVIAFNADLKIYIQSPEIPALSRIVKLSSEKIADLARYKKMDQETKWRFSYTDEGAWKTTEGIRFVKLNPNEINAELPMAPQSLSSFMPKPIENASLMEPMNVRSLDEITKSFASIADTMFPKHESRNEQFAHNPFPQMSLQNQSLSFLLSVSNDLIIVENGRPISIPKHYFKTIQKLIS